MKIHPVNDYIVVDIIKKPTRTTKGIHLAEDSESAQLNMVIAKVIAVGKGEMLSGGIRRPIDCKVGDLVEFAGGAPAFPYKSTELVEIDKTFENYWVINFGHIHSIIVLGKNEQFRTDAEDEALEKKKAEAEAAEAKQEYDKLPKPSSVIAPAPKQVVIA